MARYASMQVFVPDARVNREQSNPRYRRRAPDRNLQRRCGAKAASCGRASRQPIKSHRGDVAAIRRVACDLRLLRHGDLLLGLGLLWPWHLSRRVASTERLAGIADLKRNDRLLPVQRIAGRIRQRCPQPDGAADGRPDGRRCFGASTAMIGMVQLPWQLFAVYLVMSFGWATMSVGAITNILGLWFDRRRGLAISLALTGASASGVVIIPALVSLIARCGLEAAMIIAGAVMVVTLVPITLVWMREPASDPASSRQRRGAADRTGAAARWT